MNKSKKKEKTQITKDISTDPETIKRVISKYYKQLCADRFNNLEEMDYKLPNLNHKIDHPNSPIKT